VFQVFCNREGACGTGRLAPDSSRSARTLQLERRHACECLSREEYSHIVGRYDNSEAGSSMSIVLPAGPEIDSFKLARLVEEATMAEITALAYVIASAPIKDSTVVSAAYPLATLIQ